MQFHLQDGLLQHNDELFISSKSTTVEQIYQEDSACILEDMKGMFPAFSLKDTPFKQFFGTWRTRGCGANKMIITNEALTFFEKSTPIIAMNEVKKDEYWLTIMSGTTRHGVKIIKTNDGLYVWNGEFSSWSRFKFIPEADCN